ncbi:endonuclease/exonuclease/phosphatase (EEP) superfamily protein YafD [Jatrophihabitans sp. GAS493]|uniref:endonuclease/exonuclease/phosphatase family protein n=1 Tax=Jatrophihabitans sp. GAS493 TaxID=1907575 RepID=UPI000BB89F29|nr:endonuclease/exonuclease/phosphatase family protein [Jatrophihabitans sp. GAS493]SOD71591.1 endonuclease/exonuclease/phosphatase (EEP) superfamily protein YafD [Jatrophihabitans sp. GAS493]
MTSSTQPTKPTRPPQLPKHTKQTQPPDHRSIRRLIRRIGNHLVNYGFVAVGVLGLLLHGLSFRISSLLALAAFSGYLIALTPVALLLTGLRRQLRPFVFAVIVTVVGATVLIPRFVASDAGYLHGPRIVVMTGNLRLGSTDPASVVRLVREHHVNVLMLEELTKQERANLKNAGLDAALPYSLVDPRPDARGVGLWSAYPLADREKYTTFTFALVSARLLIPGQSASPTVAATHMPGPFPQSPDDWLKDMARLPKLLSLLENSATPYGGGVLVGGDFNATLDTAQFRKLLSDGYNDAGEQAGAGGARTYPADTWYPPLIGIDHVLTNKATAQSLVTVSLPGSDHRGVITTVRLDH